MALKPLIWIGSSRKDLSKFPDTVQRSIGYALYMAQKGDRSDNSKVLKGFGNAHVMEVIEDDTSGTYRMVYTVQMPKAIVALHAFQKKSKHGIKTTMRDMNLINQRLNQAKEVYATLKFEF